MWYGWTNVVIGAWLALTPLVSLQVPTLRLNNLCMGVLAAVVSGYTPTKKTWESWLGIAAGTWIAFSSSFQWCVEGTGYVWNNAASGILIFTSGWLILSNPPIGKHA